MPLRSRLLVGIQPPSGDGEVSPDPGINLNITGVNSNPAIVIQDESATFDNDGPLNVTFTQLSADAVALIEFQGATIDNATGQDWSGFTFSLTGPASFNGVSNAFVPPQSPGVDYNIASLNTPIIVKYTGTQRSAIRFPPGEEPPATTNYSSRLNPPTTWPTPRLSHWVRRR